MTVMLAVARLAIGMAVTELPILWPFGKPEDVVPAVLASTARVGPMLAMQPGRPARRRRLASARRGRSARSLTGAVCTGG
jgi:hypothetical protein